MGQTKKIEDFEFDDSDFDDSDFEFNDSDFDLGETEDDGIDIEGIVDTEAIEEDDDIEIDEGCSLDITNEDVGVEDTDNKVTMKKKAVVVIGVGVCVIAIAVFIGRLVDNARDSNKREQTVINIDTQKEVDSKKNKNSTQGNNESVLDKIDAGMYSKDGWADFDDSTQLEFSEPIESLFTVTSINSYVKTANDTKDIILKTILKGSISGLVGTYEIEVPYDITYKLRKGDSFQITYRLSEYNQKNIVEDITYK